jgi:phospholipid transport system substrate-binding protein
MDRRGLRLLLALFLLAAVFPPSSSSAGEASDAVKSTIDEVLAVLRSANLTAGKLRPEIREKLKSTVSSRFDFAEMAKRSLGAHWPRQSPQDQQQFVATFTDLLVNSYADTLASYKGEKIRYLDESQEDGSARVRTAISNSRGEEFRVDYRLHRTNNGWKVYDVVIEDVSLVNNFRSQFTRSLNNSSFADLLQTMRSRGVSTPGA